MSTRRLILLALACGMAILVAGSVQLLRLSRSENTVEIGAVGTAATIDGVGVTFLEHSAADRVVVRIAVPDGREELADAASPWAVRVGGTPFPAIRSVFPSGPADCAEIGPVAGGESAECQLRFAPTGEGTRYLQFTLRGKTAVWSLDA
jgi:hypothetical protein